MAVRGRSERARLADLTGQVGQSVVAQLAERLGAVLLRATPRYVDHRPPTTNGPGSTTLCFRARLQWPDSITVQTLVITSASVRVGTGVHVLREGGRSYRGWSMPDDPTLPGLQAIYDDRALVDLLADHGLPIAGQPQIRTRAYRPRRRAVVEVTAGDVHIFIKAVRPSRVDALLHRHRLLYDAGVPVPEPLGCTPEGLLLTAALPGVGLREQMRSGSPLPTAPDLIDVLDRLPPAVLDLPARRSWSESAPHYASILSAALPAQRAQVRRLAATITDGTTDNARVVPTHGDFYESQILVRPDGTVSGVLDVDSAGPGQRADDLACLIAHASLLTAIESSHATKTKAVAAAWQAAAEQQVGVAELRLRVAGVLLSLATGPHRVHRPGWEAATRERLDLVEQWVGSVDHRR